MNSKTHLCLAVAMSLGAGVSFGDEDILIADFEQDEYGDWKVEGHAFGTGPAKGTLPGQMAVNGFKGKGLVNTFLGGDQATGTLTSPPFKIERDHIAFLIGGGGHKDKTCINLLAGEEVLRTATGTNVGGGGSEELIPQYWEVSDLKGKPVAIQIVDAESGGWGHLNVDHLIQTDEKPKVPKIGPQEREFTVEKKYLVIPIKNGAKGTRLILEVDGKPVRSYGTELATDPEKVDWYAFFTIEGYKGKAARVKAARATEGGFALIRQEDTIPGSDKWYTESLRPQFHFSQAVGWNNDPNGMVYLDGEWHLYFQHNPVGWRWGNMTWGHAVSEDLVHWKQLPNVLFPKVMARGDCFSGGATVDHKNTAGWKKGDQDVLVAFLTDTGAGESIAYSNDRGRTFTWYEGNPVVKHRGRDPKVIWYAYDDKDEPLNEEAKKLGGHWVMVIYDEHKKFGRNAAFYTSTNLKEWTEQSHVRGYFECTEVFELPILPSATADPDAEPKPKETRWVVFAADAKYAIGTFDGKTFTPDQKGKHQVHWGPYYASQTFDNPPDGRRIQVGWVKIASPGMPFNQTFSFPHRLTLRSTEDGVRLFAKPVKEIEKLHKKKHTAGAGKLDAPVEVKVAGELFEVRATFQPAEGGKVGIDIGGNRVVYDAGAKRLGPAPLKPVDGKVSMQILVDRTMLETCGNDGRVFITSRRGKRGEVDKIQAFAEGEGASLVSLEVYELNSIWKK